LIQEAAARSADSSWPLPVRRAQRALTEAVDLQADAVAEAIAASVGAGINPQPFRPILRGLLLTGGPARSLRADISGEAGDDSTISSATLWWPPDKIAGRYLAPYLSGQVGDAAGVMAAGRRRTGLRTMADTDVH
jgi:hypothetical protein